MKFYIAAPMQQQHQALAWMRTLEASGHECTARWITNGEEDPAVPQAYWANIDLADIHAADAVILMTGVEGSSRGGRHFEFGYAYHAGKRCIVCGPRESVFHHLERIEQADIIEDVPPLLAQQKASSYSATPLIGWPGGGKVIG